MRSVDLFDTSSRERCLADKVELPAPERRSPDSDIPLALHRSSAHPLGDGAHVGRARRRYSVLSSNRVDAPSRDDADVDAAGARWCIAFQLTERTVRLVVSSTSKVVHARAREASLKLLKRWCASRRRSPFARNARRSRRGLRY